MSLSMSRLLSRGWTGRLSHYRRHKNDEHFMALIQEATRYIGFHLEHDLERSSYWKDVPLWKAAAVLLFLVDQGVVEREVRGERRVFVPLVDAESWVEGQLALRPFRIAFLEILSAIRHDLSRRSRSKRA